MKAPRGFAKSRLLWSAALIVSGVGALVVWSFMERRSESRQEAAQDQPIKTPSRVRVENGRRVIALDAAARRQSGIETVTLHNVAWHEPLRAYGSVLDLQPLTELANHYAGAKARLQTEQAKLSASRTAAERARVLYQDEQNVSAAQLQAAEAAFGIDRAGVAAAQSELLTLARTAEQVWGTVLGRALVANAPILARLIERKQILLRVTLPGDAALAKPPASASVEANAGSRVALDLVSAAPRTDPGIQGISYFYTAPANDALLPGMNVLAWLLRQDPVEGAIVPAAAIVWSQGRPDIYLRTAPDVFARHEVTAGMPVADGGYLVKGLPDGAQVVSRGAQMLLSEEFRSQVQLGD